MIVHIYENYGSLDTYNFYKKNLFWSQFCSDLDQSLINSILELINSKSDKKNETLHKLSLHNSNFYCIYLFVNVLLNIFSLN